MKKTLVALAALASIGSAFADAPTITPYARLDIGLSSNDTTGVQSAGLQGADSVYNGSIWGIKGETDLGGGLKGIAQVEQAFAANGADGLGGSGNARVGKIGIAGGFGTLEIGAVWGPYDNAPLDAQDYNHFSGYGAAINGGAHWDEGNGTLASGNTAASINYTSPAISGATVQVNLAPQKDANNVDTSSYGVGVSYAGGPLAVNFALDRTPTKYSHVDRVLAGSSAAWRAAAAAGTNTKFTNAWILNGSYNLGVASVFLGTFGATANTIAGSDTDTGYGIGLKAPVGKWTLSTSYGSVKTSGDDLNQTLTSFGAQGLYAFNKQFTGYVGTVSTKTAPTVGASSTSTTYGAGFSMSF